MKLKFVYTTLSTLILIFLLVNFSGGPAGTRGQDRTGGPFSDSGVPCNVCHNNGSFNPGMSIELLDSEAIVSQYIPGKSYRIRYSIVATSGTPGGYGFQSVILSTPNNENVGQFAEPGEGMRVADIDGRKYVEHTTPNSNNIFEVEWTAPETGTGTITIYSAGVASNLNGSNGGDNGATATLELMEDIESFTNEIANIESIHIFPNPVSDYLNLDIEVKTSKAYQLTLFDLHGKAVQQEKIQLQPRRNLHSINMGALTTGFYTLQISEGQKILSQKILKK